MTAREWLRGWALRTGVHALLWDESVEGAATAVWLHEVWGELPYQDYDALLARRKVYVRVRAVAQPGGGYRIRMEPDEVVYDLPVDPETWYRRSPRAVQHHVGEATERDVRTAMDLENPRPRRLPE